MDSDPSQIPVEPISFEYGLTHFAQSLRGRARIVAIGSSSTVGHGNIRPYPGRLLSLLQAQYPNAKITMVNQGIGGQEAPIEFQRFGFGPGNESRRQDKADIAATHRDDEPIATILARPGDSAQSESGRLE